MKVKRLKVYRFSAFEDAVLECSSGINVLIGANGTGKSHILKLLYSMLKANEARDSKIRKAAALRIAAGYSTMPKANEARHNGEATRRGLDPRLAEKLGAVFKPDDGAIGRLVNRARRRGSCKVELQTSAGELRFTLTTLGNLRVVADTLTPGERCVFLPSREALAMYEGFISAYTNRELSFDETYYDLCVALSGGALRGKRLEKAGELVHPLEHVLGGKVHLKGGRFYVFSAQGQIEAHLLAEGWRKIACLVRLIVNGSLIRNGFLVWDEPEANLNPALITQMARVLRSLAASGVQVFVATHDYLLTHALSLAAEYHEPPTCEMRFFAFSRENDEKPVTVESGEVLADLSHNLILEEFARHYDHERKLFEGSSQKGTGSGR